MPVKEISVNKETFDVALCMGPLYHISKDETDQCISQCLQVLKKPRCSLWCWETEEALNWAKGLFEYLGPDAVCP